jgi:hypothetical protein
VAGKKRGVHERIGSDLSETFRILLGDGQPTHSRADGGKFQPGARISADQGEGRLASRQNRQRGLSRRGRRAFPAAPGDLNA